MDSEKNFEIKNTVKPDTNTNTKINCLNNYHSYLLCKELAKDMYQDLSSCKELEKFLLANCENKSFIYKCLYNNK